MTESLFCCRVGGKGERRMSHRMVPLCSIQCSVSRTMIHINFQAADLNLENLFSSVARRCDSCADGTDRPRCRIDIPENESTS